jgi:pimeloyl-ACP methyl ester carboxylesterase
VGDRPRIGQALADRIACLADASVASNGPGKVIVVGHSMGGLATRQAASLQSGGRAVSERLGLVVTLGTPHEGSWLEGFLTQGSTGGLSASVLKVLSEALSAGCKASIPEALGAACEIVKLPTSDAALAMRPGSDQLKALPKFPAGPVFAVAGNVHLVVDLFGREQRLDEDIGDLLVRADSATSTASRPEEGGGRHVRDCDINIFALVARLGWTSCTHGGILTDLDVVGATGRAIQKWFASRPLDRSSQIDIRGIGPVRIGMTVAEAERASGVPFEVQGFEAFDRECYHVLPRGMDGLAFMASPRPGERLTDPRQGRIVRVSVSKTPHQTLSGIRVGSTEGEVLRTYPGQLAIEPHAYTPRGNGQYLTLRTSEPSDQAFGVRFVTVDGQVRQILAGNRDAIQLVEGCA